MESCCISTVHLAFFTPQMLRPAGTNRQPHQEQFGTKAAGASVVQTLAGRRSFPTTIYKKGASSKMTTSSSLLFSMVRMKNTHNPTWTFHISPVLFYYSDFSIRFDPPDPHRGPCETCSTQQWAYRWGSHSRDGNERWNSKTQRGPCCRPLLP